MPTIKDIAAKAGVSHGTVSNVLNKKGNVSAEKIQLVERIAKELGYKMNVQAKQLRAGTARRVCIIVPNISLKSYNDLYLGLNQYLVDYDFSIELFCTNNLVCNEERAVKKALSLNPMAVVIVSSMLKNRGLFTNDTKFFFVERKVRGMPEHALYISFAFDKAGKDIALRCIDDGYKNIALLCENSNYSSNKNFVDGVTEVLEDYNCTYKIFSNDDSKCFNKAFDILNSKEEFDAVITISREDADYIKAAYQYNKDRKMPAIYALTSKSIGIDPDVCRYEMNYKLLGRTIAKWIVSNSEEEREVGFKELKEQGRPRIEQVILENDGFYNNHITSTPIDSSVCFLTIKNMTSKAIQMLLPSFTRETGIKVNMIEVSYDEHYKMSQACIQNSPYDLIRIDMAWMSELGGKIYKPLDEANPDVKWLKERILPTMSENYSVVNGIRYAFPLDACVQMLFYRKDLFEDDLIKREFFETNKRRLEIPRTFKEYNEVAKFFTKKENSKSKTRFGALTTYGSPFLAACDFLPRFRESSKDIFDSNGRVNILIPEMKQAVLNYLDTCRYTSNDIYQWWGEPTRLFSEGDVAMHIVFSNYASEMIHDLNSKVVGKIGYATIPGGQPLSGGGSVGISKFSQKYKECMKFLQWLYRRDIAEMITYLGGYVCGRELNSNIDILELYPWLEDMTKSFEPGWRNYRHEKNPDFNEFLFENILGKAIRSIALGIEDVDTALSKAQAECDRIFNVR